MFDQVYGVEQPVLRVWRQNDPNIALPFTYDSVLQVLRITNVGNVLPNKGDAEWTVTWSTLPFTPTSAPPAKKVFFTPTVVVIFAAGAAAILALGLGSYCYCFRDADGYSAIEKSAVSGNNGFPSASSSAILSQDYQASQSNYFKPSSGN